MRSLVSPVFFSTMEDGTVVQGLGALPADRWVRSACFLEQSCESDAWLGQAALPHAKWPRSHCVEVIWPAMLHVAGHMPVDLVSAFDHWLGLLQLQGLYALEPSSGGISWHLPRCAATGCIILRRKSGCTAGQHMLCVHLLHVVEAHLGKCWLTGPSYPSISHIHHHQVSHS